MNCGVFISQIRFIFQVRWSLFFCFFYFRNFLGVIDCGDFWVVFVLRIFNSIFIYEICKYFLVYRFSFVLFGSFVCYFVVVFVLEYIIGRFCFCLSGESLCYQCLYIICFFYSWFLSNCLVVDGLRVDNFFQGFLIYLIRFFVLRGNIMFVYLYWSGKNSVVCQVNNSVLGEKEIVVL